MYKYYDQFRINEIKNLIYAKKFDNAENKINKYKKEFPNDELIGVYEAKLLCFRKRYDEAEELLRFLIDKGINRKYVYYSAVLELAEVLKCKNDLDNAIKYYKMCCVSSDNPVCYYAVIKTITLYLNVGDCKGAIGFVEKLPKSIRNPMIDIKKAEIYFADGNNKKALNLLNNISDSKLDEEGLQHKYYLLCKIYYLNGDRKTVLEIIDKCFVIKNRLYWKAYIILAKIKSLHNKEEEAIEMCKNAIRIHPIPEAKEALIKIYIKLGMKNEAKEAVEMYFDDNDDYLKNYYNGRIALLYNDYASSEKYIENALKLRPLSEDDEAKYYLIIVKFRLKKYDEAYELINNFSNKINGKAFKFHINNDINMMRAFIEKDYRIETYNITQLANYTKDLAVKHVLNNHYYTGEFNNEIIKSESDIIKLFDDIEEKIEEKNKIIRGFCDTYVIYYENIGYLNNEKLTDFIEVVCIPNTHNIITMFPTNKSRENEEIRVNEKPKTKRLSQIDKFYKRYGK